MRDRLIGLLRETFDYTKGTCIDFDEAVEINADFLLTNGVIVPPVKVGDVVYCIRYDRARKPYVKPLGVLSITTYGKDVVTLFTTRDDRLGSTAFLTEEEAEKALKERREV